MSKLPYCDKVVCLCVCGTSADNAYACDPRVKKFKETVKAEKEAEKRAKLEAAKKEAAQRRQVRSRDIKAAASFSLVLIIFLL